MELGVSGAAMQAQVRTRASGKRKGGSEEGGGGGGGEGGEIPVGSGLMGRGLSDLELENVCRLQYARWSDEEEYVSATGSAPDRWPSGLYKSTKKKGDDCKFYWKRVPEWKHMWIKASSSK